MPVLELYRQMAIRQQKAKSFEQALVNLPEVEVLTCSTCGREFHRTRLRRRKPLHRPECRDQTA